MNTLYVIKWLLHNGFEISRSSFWSAEAVKEKMEKNPEWKFELVEVNPNRVVWEAR